MKKKEKVKLKKEKSFNAVSLAPVEKEKELELSDERKQNITEQTETQEEKLSYKRIDCENGCITNPAEIASYKAVQNVDIIYNALLGDFNNVGEYIISYDIINELVNQTKCITTSYQGMIFCEGYNSSELFKNKYVVKMKPDEKNVMTASLYLLEKVEKISGNVINTISTRVGFFASDDSIFFMERMKLAFNIVDVTEAETKSADNKLHYIMLRKKYQTSINNLCKAEITEIQKIAYLKKLAILKANKDIPEEIFKEILEKSEKIKDFPDETKFKALNEMLDMVVENNQDKLKPIMSQIQEVNTSFAEKINISNAHTVAKLISIQKTEDGKKILLEQIEAQKNASETKRNHAIVKVDGKIKENYTPPKDVMPEQPVKDDVAVGAVVQTDENLKKNVNELKSKQKSKVEPKKVAVEVKKPEAPKPAKKNESKKLSSPTKVVKAKQKTSESSTKLISILSSASHVKTTANAEIITPPQVNLKPESNAPTNSKPAIRKKEDSVKLSEIRKGINFALYKGELEAKNALNNIEKIDSAEVSASQILTDIANSAAEIFTSENNKKANVLKQSSQIIKQNKNKEINDEMENNN